MIGRLVALLIGLCAGLAASQAPEFAQQYRQRLGGAIDELRSVLARFDDTAQAFGLSREQAIARFGEQADPVVRDQGPAMATLAGRLARLEEQRARLQDAAPFERLLVTVREADPGLARAAYLDYEPAWPATSEGLVLGGGALAAVWLAALALFRSLGRLRPSRWRHGGRAPPEMRRA